MHPKIPRIPGGFLLVIEGIDGAGKTTQAGLAAQFFGARGIPCLFSKEPTSRKWGQKLRETAKTRRLSPKDELDFFIKDRKDHIENVIRPNLEEGFPVILDRYFFSTAAYQGSRGIDYRSILLAHEKFAPKPDLLLVIDIAPKFGLARIKRRGDTPNTFETFKGLSAAREIFNSLEGDFVEKIDGYNSLGEVNRQVTHLIAKSVIAKIEGSELAVKEKKQLISALNL